jgi:hypothetical protein
VNSFAESIPLIQSCGFYTCVWDSAGEDEVERYLEDESWFYPLQENGKTYLVLPNDVCNHPQPTQFAGKWQNPYDGNPFHTGKTQRMPESN